MSEDISKHECPKFPKRIVLGEGWPYGRGDGPSTNDPLRERGEVVGLSVSRRRIIPQEILKNAFHCDNPLNSDDCPKYRLVLERIEP